MINKMYYKIGLMLVDEYVISGKTEEAFDLLNELAQINDSNIIDYKLGLLYFEQDPKKALEYFEKVYKSDYSIINFDLYKRLLENLQMDAYYRNDTCRNGVI
ncbi:MAG: tetratricopeptide repeat protein [Candidatus Melainabacteria bacterium]|nr:MAG: tetratricopeptide repeat protein [Candidatus Melainabacteria bacterium]